MTRDDDSPESPTENGMPVMDVRFSPFNEWYEINSYYEGQFLERTVPGAFKATINAQRQADGSSSVKVLFNHGMDFTIGDKVLGKASELREGSQSPEMLVPLFDTSYTRDLMDGLRAGVYGSSFMFEVIRDSWDHEPARSTHNPEGLPERTILEVRLLEAGPVTWPANPAATAGLRSGGGTDAVLERMQDRDPGRYGDLSRSFEAFRSLNQLRDRKDAPSIAPSPDDSSRRQVASVAAPSPDGPSRRQAGRSPAVQAAARRYAELLTSLARTSGE
ncbi:HK97 family phage prohead protease [Micromonospora sp. D93]|uniref:HK97 family phage prohead protease n=1 Tax=Micromonospora sp. D93 TaxID=2824886 RepID=UPI001B397FD4|nr:HK97 family phage prohead protease [Micromonospora sp. D93]MBQ1017753.1 HK97 family phage prohead protease [Micromonospora sp. D93]